MDRASKTLKIETWVQARKKHLATREILRWAKAHAGDETTLIQCSDWLRRLGLYRQAYLLLRHEEVRGGERRHLHAARMLNLLGASALALELVAKHTNWIRVSPELRADEHRILGNIYLSGFDWDSARFHFERMAALEPRPYAHAARMGLIGLGDALIALGEIDAALAVVQGVIAASNETLLLGIAHQAIGEYYARAGRYDEAWPWLERADGLIPASEGTLDRGFLSKWRAYVLARRGQPAAARTEFARAEELLRRPDLRIEAWLDCRRLQAELGWLDGAELSRLGHYPGTSAGFRAQLGTAVPAEVDFGPARARIWIDLARDEYRVGDQWALAIPKELRLLGHLACAGDWGVSLPRLQSLLWPQEALSFAQLEDRLHKLLRRLRQMYRLSLPLREAVVQLSSRDARAVGVHVGPASPPAWLSARTVFSGREMGAHYGLAKSQAAVHLAAWRERGWIGKEGVAAHACYRVISS